MDLRALTYFLTIAREGSITRAAEKLCMAQPPLSRQMKQLEAELGTTLFIRGHRHIQLTEAGRYLRQQAEAILALAGQTEKQIARMHHTTGGSFTIAATESCGIKLLPDMLARYTAAYPDVSITLFTGNTQAIEDQLAKNLVDIGLVRAPFDDNGYIKKPLARESWCVLLPPDHPLIAEHPEAVPLAALSGLALAVPVRARVQEAIRGWFADSGLPLTIRIAFTTLTAVIGMVGSTIDAVICPESYKPLAEGFGLTLRILDAPPKPSTLYLVRKEHHLLPDPAERFFDMF